MKLLENDFFIDEIVHSLKSKDYSLPFIVGREKKCIDIALFFFYYARYSSDEQSEEYAYNLIEKVLSSPYWGRNIFYSTGLTGIGSCLIFLEKEKFVEIDADDVFLGIDDNMAKVIKNYILYNYSFSTGLIGLCHYMIERQKYPEVIHIALDKLIKSFTPSDNKRMQINPVFLYPSEILEDLKLFVSTVEKEKMFPDFTHQLRNDIELFELNKDILQSNCNEYKIIQQIRKAKIENNMQEIPSLLQSLIETTSDIVLKGLSYMYLKNPTLPTWWTLL